MPHNPKFSISILAMNGLDMTRRCVESVMKHSRNYELILTDNASDDGTTEYFDFLKDSYPNLINFWRNDTNAGFAEPNNDALLRARGKYFITLNNDTEVPKNWLTLLERPFLEYPDAAITGPAGSPCSFQAPYPSFHGSAGPNLEYIEGSCLCIPTALAREHGLFAPYLHFAYGEDADLSLRMRARGRSIHQVPFKLVHHRSRTAAQVDNIDEIQRRNHEALIKRWGKYLEFRRFDLPFVVRRREAIGDVLLTTPLIAEMHRQNPKSEIYVETNHPELFRDNPAVTAAGSNFPHVYRWATVIDLDMSYENMPETNIIEAYYKTAHIIRPPSDMFIGCQPELFPNRMESQLARALLGGKKWLAVHAGPTTWAGKNWPWERWEELCRRLTLEGWRIVLVGLPGPSLPHLLDLRGRTDFQQLAAALRECRLFVGVDSFPMHVATAIGTPVVGLFGATDPRYILNDPNAEPVCGTSDCAGARHRVAGQTYVDCDGACMQSISVDMVSAAIQKITK